MSIDVGALLAQAQQAAVEARRDGDVSGDDRERLKQIAAQFESMLMLQMLRDMRKAASWGDGEEHEAMGAEALFEAIDVELASHLARAKGMGLASELLAAFDRLQPAGPTAGDATSGGGAPTIAPPASPAGVASPARPPVEAPEGPAGRLRPVSGAVTSDFGWRRDPFTSRVRFHQGVDLRAAYGQEVSAAASGRVVFSGEAGGYGTSVVLEHADGTKTRYAHLSAALVETGDRVEVGTAVGRAGRSGRATGTHLHFEVIGADGRRMEPRQWVTAGGRPGPALDDHRGGSSAAD